MQHQYVSTWLHHEWTPEIGDRARDDNSIGPRRIILREDTEDTNQGYWMRVSKLSEFTSYKKSSSVKAAVEKSQTLSYEINGKQVRIPEKPQTPWVLVECSRWAFQFEFSFILITLFEAERRIVGLYWVLRGVK